MSLSFRSPRFDRLGSLTAFLGLILFLFAGASAQTFSVVPYSVLGSQTPIAAAVGGTVAVDSKDNVYYSTFFTNAVNRIDVQGNTTTVPTTGLNGPQGLRFDASDNLYICDPGNSRIVLVTPAGVQSVVPVAGLQQPNRIAFDPGYQNLYISDRYAGILVYNIVSQKTTVYANNLFHPYGIAVDAQGNVFYGDGGTLVRNRVSYSTAVGEPDGLVFDKAGNLYIEGSALRRMDPSGNILELADAHVNDIAIDSKGTILLPSGQYMLAFLPGPAIWGGRNDAFVGGRIAYNYANLIRTYYSTPSGVNLSSLAIPTAGSPYGGDNNPTCFTATLCGANMSLGAFLPGPQPGYAVATFSDGKIVNTPLYGSGVQVEMGFTPGTASSIQTPDFSFGGIASPPAGSNYVSDTAGNRVLNVSGSAAKGTFISPAALTGLSGPTQLAVDGAGSLYVLDAGNQRIVKLDSSNAQTVAFDLGKQGSSLPGGLTSLQSFAVDGATNLYLGGLNSAKAPVIALLPAVGSPVIYATAPSVATVLGFDTFGALYAEEAQGTLVKYDHFGNRIVVASGVSAASSMAIEPSGTVYLAGGLSASLMQVSPAGVVAAYKIGGVAQASVVRIDNYGSLTVGDSSTGMLTMNDRTTQPYTFGKVTTGTSSTLHDSLVNVGSKDGMSISSITGANAFAVDAGMTTCLPGTTVLAAGGACEIGYSFSPTAAQNYAETGQVVIPLPTPYYSATVANLALTGSGVKAQPVANAGGPYTGTVGTSVTFSGTASNDPNNEALTYAWAFGDTTTATGATPTHTYLNAGTYTVSLTVTNTDGATASASTTATISQIATQPGSVLMFLPAPVGVAPTAAQTMTATFTINASAPFTPTATLHYGLSYSLGAVTCAGNGPVVCTVPVTFKPQYPGGRRDAVFLMNGTTRLATMLLSGLGQGPLSLMEPGVKTVITPPLAAQIGGQYYYNSVVDEAGTAYVVSTIGDAVVSITSAGVITQLPITGLHQPHAIALDGAGVLYTSNPSGHNSVVTYDTILGTSASLPNPNGTLYILGLALGDNGNLFETDQNDDTVYRLSEFSGAVQTTAVAPGSVQPYSLIVDSGQNLFFAGSNSQNELQPNGTQTQINQIGSQSGYVVDAADSLYLGRISRTQNVGILQASNKWTAVAGPELNPNSSPLGLGVGGDGTLWVGNYYDVDKIDRSQGALVFDAINPGQAAHAQTAYLYNGGNQPLTLTSLTLTGDSGYTLGAQVSGIACAAGMSIPAGSLCGVGVNFSALQHDGVIAGSLTFLTNSLNTATTQTVTLTDQITGRLAPVANAGGPYKGAPGTGVSFNGTGSTDPNNEALTYAWNFGDNASGTGAFPTHTYIAAGNYTVSLTVTNTDGTTASASTTATISQSYTASLTPASFSFGPVAVGASATTVFTLTNTGTGAFDVGTVQLAAEPTSSFSTTNNCTNLASGASCAIIATFKPTVSGDLATSLIIKDAAGTQTASITGSGAFFSASLTPATYDFGKIGVGLTTSKVFTLTNTSPASIAIKSVVLAPESSNSYSSTQTCGASLAVNASCTVTITYKPSSPGGVAFSTGTNLTITDDAGSQTASVVGTAVAPVVTLTPATYDFGKVSVGLTPSKVYTLTNTSPSTVAISSIVLSPEMTNSYSSTQTCGTSLASNASCTVTITYKPTASGGAAFSSGTTLTVLDDGGTQTAMVMGTAVAPVVTLTPPVYDFGTVVVGSTQSTVLTLTNTSQATVAIQSVTFSLDLTGGLTSTKTCGDTLAAGTSCTITITLAPKLANLTSGTNIAIMDDGGTQRAMVYGNVVAYTATLTPAAYDFGTVAAGSTQTSVFTLTNTSPASINLGLIVLAPESTGSYSYTRTCGTTLAANASCAFTVFYKPTTGGTSSTTLNITDDAGTQKASITGKATVVSATLTPATFNFGNIGVNTNVSHTFTLTNTGTDPLKPGTLGLAPEPTASYEGTNNCGTAALAPGASCTFTVTFEPVAGGPSATTLNVVNAAGTQTAAISGTAVAPTATLTPATFDFKNVALGDSSVSTFTFTNTSTVSLSVGSANIANQTGGAAFTSSGTCPASLTAGATCSIRVTFTPVTTGAAGGVLVIQSGAGAQTAALAGNGVTPITSSTYSVDFGTIPAGADARQTITLTNKSSTDAPVTFPYPRNTLPPSQIFDAFSSCATLNALTQTITVPANGSCAVTLDVDYPAIGLLRNTFTFTGSGYTVDIAETANVIAVPTFDLTLPTSALSFDNFGHLVTAITVSSASAQYPFTGTISLSASGLPPGTTYTFDPANLVAGATAATSNLTIQLPASRAQLNSPGLLPAEPRKLPALAGALGALLLLLWKRRRVRLPQLLAVLLTIAALSSLAGCGAHPYELPDNTGTVTITGTSGTTVVSTTITVHTL